MAISTARYPPELIQEPDTLLFKEPKKAVKPYQHVSGVLTPALSLLRMECRTRCNTASNGPGKKKEGKPAKAEKNEGGTGIGEALKARALYFTKIGDEDAALPALTLAIAKTPGLRSRIDLTLTLVRHGFFANHTLITKSSAEAEKLIDEGGDWNCRNRLKVYTSLRLLSIRQFKRAAGGFLDALSTLTATELISFHEFVAMGVVSGVLTVGRGEVKKQNSKKPCSYLPASSPLTHISTSVTCILACTQLLEYRSLTVENLAREFGVSGGFIESELSRFIASGRVHPCIDKVHGIVETTRPNTKTAQYEQVVKKGDLLFNEMQRLSKVLH
ncbi:26S proteasome subunit RPN7-domain-containing protein [Coprinopsis sp. MPI-PUGE-AT-0042]|nr:26S proteasome subunit RPN7-domain-containing protein [Coprinopsis sp. MPI-PUGE-AT-0042]